MKYDVKEPFELLSGGSYNMKNAEFASVRGVPAVVVSLRSACLLSAAKREFIWHLQSLSLKDGGFRRVARELVEMFPDRLGILKTSNAKILPAELTELRCQALTPQRPTTVSYLSERPSISRLSIEEFLVELCTNPKIQFSLPGIDSALDELETELASERNPELEPYNIERANLRYFRDIIGALLEYRSRQKKKIRDDFQHTAISQKIWETLDYALASRNMVLLDGLEGRGKTEAVKAWCELHQGQTRLVSLKGVTNKTTAFREIASSLGISYSYTRAGTEMQARIEDVLSRSKIMLVIDEAHFAFNQTRQMKARPELIDWIDTAICNRSVPVALVTTPQFIACMARAKNQVDWNFHQFRRRVKRWVKLPVRNTESDLAAVARKVFQNCSEAVIKKVVGYALLSKRDLSAVGDVASEVRAMLGTETLAKVSVEHVHRAITEFLIPSDLAFRVSLDEAEAKPSNRRSRAPQLPPEASEEPEPMEPAAESLPALEGTPGQPGRNHRMTIPTAARSCSDGHRGGFEAALTTV